MALGKTVNQANVNEQAVNYSRRFTELLNDEGFAEWANSIVSMNTAGAGGPRFHHRGGEHADRVRQPGEHADHRLTTRAERLSPLRPPNLQDVPGR